MITIKDIARLAGVSQGTVSNVLNNKGSVRSDKIKRVLQIAEENGYTINESARILRKGEALRFAVIVPNIQEPIYHNFYTTFESKSFDNGYLTYLFVTNGKAEKEKSILNQVRSIKFDALVILGSTLEDTSEYEQLEIEKGNIVFVDQRHEGFSNIGFDYNKIAKIVCTEILKRKYKNLVCFATNHSPSSSVSFIPALKAEIATIDKGINVAVNECGTAVTFNARTIASVLSSSNPDLIVSDSQKTSRIVKEIAKLLFPEKAIPILSLSCADYIPRSDALDYELNYKYLAEEIVNFLLEKKENKLLDNIIPPTGFNQFANLYIPTGKKEETSISILTLTSPTTEAMECSKILFRKKYGCNVIFKAVSYEEMYSLLSGDNDKIDADMLRIDAKLSKFFAEKHFYPLNCIGDTKTILSNFPQAICKKYVSDKQDIFFLPSTPSVQILFYRKDLFDNYVLQRLFYEQTKHELHPPKNFEEYNRIAQFFTHSLNPASPINYGSTITIGSPSMAAIEFLMRYFARVDNLFGENGELFPNKDAAIDSLTDLLDIMPATPDVKNTWWLQSAKDFANGDIAMTIQLTNHVAMFEDMHSNVTGKLGWAITPGANPILGGSVIGINRSSRQKELSFEYIKWIQEKSVANLNAMLGAHSGNRNVLDNQYINEIYPWLPLSRKAIEASSYPLFPPENINIDMYKIETLLGNVILDVLNGNLDAAKACEYMQYSYHMMKKIF